MPVPKLSEISAACGPYIMSWKISPRTIPSRITSPPTARVEQGEVREGVQAGEHDARAVDEAPAQDLSESQPKNGTLTMPMQAAMMR